MADMNAVDLTSADVWTISPDTASEVATKIMAMDWKPRGEWPVEAQCDRHGEIQLLIDEALSRIAAERDEARAYLKAFVRATIDPEDRKQDAQVHQANPSLGWVFTLNDTGMRGVRQILGSQIRRAMEIVGFGKLDIDGPPTTLADEHIAALARADRLQSELERLNAALVEEPMFPILGGPKVPWSLIAPYEAQAQKNHYQTLKRLAERGGLSISEAMAVMSGVAFENRPIAKPSVEDWLDFIAQRKARAAARSNAATEGTHHG